MTARVWRSPASRGVGTASTRIADAAMDRYAEGDDGAFSELYNALAPRLYRYLLRRTRDRARVEDLLQQTMLQLHCARSRFVRGSQVAPWAFVIATRLFLDQVRRKQLELLAVGDDEREYASSGPGPDSSLELKEFERLVRSTVERLSAPQREVFELVCSAQMSHSEAAEKLGITLASVKLRLSRANRVLREAARTRSMDARLAPC
jgi:RNA polymerase sigma-70 factor, ECF subfamily